MKKKIIQKENPMLRLKAMPIEKRDISSPEIKKIILDMTHALASEDDGVAIAAPQISKSLCIFIVSGKIFKKEGGSFVPPDLVFINPKITWRSKETTLLEEGCLSVRGLYGTVQRSKEVTLHFLDEARVSRTTKAHGLLAQIFEHEVDHLDGVLFTDKAKSLRVVEQKQS